MSEARYLARAVLKSLSKPCNNVFNILPTQDPADALFKAIEERPSYAERHRQARQRANMAKTDEKIGYSNSRD